MKISGYPYAFFHILIASIVWLPGFSQNILPNPDFETFIACPTGPGMGAPLESQPWQSGTPATPDYFNSCAPPDWVGIPYNALGYQPAHSGNAYVGVICRYENMEYREYLQTLFSPPLTAGLYYHFAMYVNLGDSTCATEHMDAFFSVAPPAPNGFQHLSVVPQVESELGQLSDTVEWVLIEGCFIAQGGEQYITIGNFYDDTAPLDPACPWSSVFRSYYFIDDVLLEEIPAPAPIVFDLGNPVIGCDSFEINPGLPGLQYEWSDGSVDSVLIVNQSGTYSVTITDGCSSGEDNLEVLFAPDPPVHIVNSDVIICDGDTYTISLDPNAGTYTWNDGTMGPVINITTSGFYSVTLNDDNCDVTADNLTVTVASAPGSDVLGPDTLILCGNNELNYSFNSFIDFVHWNDGSNATDYTITDAGTYAVTITNLCGVTTDQIVVTELDFPILDFNSEAYFLCLGDSLYVDLDTSLGEYLWQDGSTTFSYLVTQSGSYGVTVTNGCGSDTAQFNLEAITPPSVNLGPDVLMCHDQFPVTLYVNDQTGVTYEWQDGSVLDSFNVIAPGVFFVMATSLCGIVKDTVSFSSGGPPPIVALGADTTFCPGETITILPQFLNVDAWIWGNGTSTPTYTVSNNVQITIEVSNLCGSAVDTVIATLLPATPPLNLGNDTSLCPGETLLLTIPTPNVSIEWSDGSFSPQLLIQNAGEVYATISNSCGMNSDTIVINTLQAIPSLDLGPDQTLCPGESTTLDPGITNVSYLWHNGSPSVLYTTDQSGQVSLTISNVCGSVSDTIMITSNAQGPQVNLGPDLFGCEGELFTLAADIIDVDFLWQDGSTQSTFTADASGLYSITVTNACGVDTDSVAVDIHGQTPSSVLGNDTTLCAGETLLLTSNADTETSIEWQDGSMGNTFLITHAGSFHIAEGNHCGSHADTMEVFYLNSPEPFDLGQDTTLCPGEFLFLVAPVTSNLLEWQDGSTRDSLTADQAQLYSLLISNDCGSAFDDLLLSYDLRVPVMELDSPLVVCPGDSLALDISQIFPVEYDWNTGSTSPMIKIADPGNYSVTITSPCVTLQANTLLIESDTCITNTDFFIPNIFSPNGDGINDFFSLIPNIAFPITALETRIFDRWGNLVFHSASIPPIWDGNYNGSPMSPGVYAYQMEIRYRDQRVERSFLKQGDLTLIR